jgi:hypothetical protein
MLAWRYDCRRAMQNGAERELDVDPEVFERASCDSRIIGSLDPATPERAIGHDANYHAGLRDALSLTRAI